MPLWHLAWEVRNPRSCDPPNQFINTVCPLEIPGLCYSELSSRFPEGGPSFVYIYATLGELWAFIIGWSMVLEYMIASALAAKSLTQYLDSLTNGTIITFLRIPAHSFEMLPGFEDGFLDLPSAIIILSVGALLTIDLKV